MSNSQDFAKLLAAVIPVVLVALVVEARSVEQASLNADVPVRRLMWDLLESVFILGFLAFLEVAALLTADDQAGPCLRWFVGPPGAIGVGILLVLTARLGAENFAKEHNQITPSAEKVVTTVGALVTTVSIAAGMSFIIEYWPPSTADCRGWVVGGTAA
ncbi:hypothetical protein AB0D42_40475 [Streptomyces sp. NPDC048304]|uniref:hypothetical protein n=1 Tax=Streptomyces sp. NPDC048304 TaxID=3154820 RepID=UPI003408C301